MRPLISAINGKRAMPGTHYSRACISSKHPIKCRQCITANIGPLGCTIRCDRLTHTWVGGKAPYLFRSFCRAANQPTDRPTRSHRRQRGQEKGERIGGAAGRRTSGWFEGDGERRWLARLANGSRQARASETRLFVPRYSKRRYPRARRLCWG